jgi:polysaccharide export outer membrane protein
LLRSVIRCLSCTMLLLVAGCDLDEPLLGGDGNARPVAAAQPPAAPAPAVMASPAPGPLASATPAPAAAAAPVQAAPAPAAPTPIPDANAGAPVPADPSTNSYQIGPGDDLNIFVWRNPDLSTKVPVRPDGKISIPLVEDVSAIGKTPSALARELEEKLRAYVKEPIVTVLVAQFVGPYSQQVRVIGEAAQPRAIPYRANMTVLDVMIEVGGLTKFASGDRAVIMRTQDGRQESVPVHLDSLIKDGDVAANVAMRPGDILIIPQRYF